jgi:hypothetical protein
MQKLRNEPEGKQTGKIANRIRDLKCVNRARIFKSLWNQGIDTKGSIPPAYVAWRAGTITLCLLGS